MRNLDLKGQAGWGKMAQLLIWGGAVLLFAGGLLVYPYVSSRLAVFPATPTPMAHSPRPTALPLTAAHISPAGTPTAPPHTPAPTPVPTPTPTPALPTRLVIPAIGLDAFVIPVSWRTVEVDGQKQRMLDLPAMRAVGWHVTSAPPGVVGNTVLSGHNTTQGEVFRDLYTLEIGEIIVVYADDTPHTYAVTEMLILPEAGQPLEVRVENARYILPTEDERLTLVTCHPYGSLRNRLIVIAHPVTVEDDWG